MELKTTSPTVILPPTFANELSLFEKIFSSYPPIIESLIAHLPTLSVLDLYHTSRHLRTFLAHYPLAWSSLSFRNPQPALVAPSPGYMTPDGRDRLSRLNNLDSLFALIIIPIGTRLKNIDLCNTAISGEALTSDILTPRVDTIQHVSVRGCKNVSIKYHLLPFLNKHNFVQKSGMPVRKLALKSLYTYRCRHHRRRPYLPSSLIRKDSDSEPTHLLIELCHKLGIWTDTAWCPSQGPRCSRRKDYHLSRIGPPISEIWVPFDRLWRSGNRIGRAEDGPAPVHSDGRLWEEMESGYNGEALGTRDGPFRGEGKDVPTHLRRSHRSFVENFKCDQCGDPILERCEQCSVRMHCNGCRKTLCDSCAFNKPVCKDSTNTRVFATQAFGVINVGSWVAPQGNMSGSLLNQGRTDVALPPQNMYWWAPGAIMSPNLMRDFFEEANASYHTDNGTATPTPLKLNMHWCCLEPLFSGGGGIAFLGPGLGGRGADRIRAAPLPRGKNYEDTEFLSALQSPAQVEAVKSLKNQALYEQVIGEDLNILPFLSQDSLDLLKTSCPRSLCKDCYRTFRWKVTCRGCKKPLCKEHDFRALKVRKCGYRDLNVEREYIRRQPVRTDLRIPAFKDKRPEIDTHGQSNHAATDVFGISSPAAQSPTLDNDPRISTIFTSNDQTITVHKIYIPEGSTIGTPGAIPISDSIAGRQRAASYSSVQTRPGMPLQYCRSPGYQLSQRRVPLPGQPNHPVQWKGCGAYYCQQYRPVGDTRLMCSGKMKECVDCGVHVCEACLSAKPPCSCILCKGAYHCPHCFTKPVVQSKCRADKDREGARRAEEKRIMGMIHLKRADAAAEALGEFFAGLDEGAPSG